MKLIHVEVLLDCDEPLKNEYHCSYCGILCNACLLYLYVCILKG